MTLLIDVDIPRALDALLARFGDGACRGERIEAWLFEDVAERREAERRLAEAGVTARLRSAYKPLVHAVLEEIDLAGAAAVTVQTPAHPAGSERRFRIEAYPLAGLIAGTTLAFAPGEAALDYVVTVERPDGARETHRVFAPNRVQQDHLGETVLAPCGWLRHWRAGAARADTDGPDTDGPLPTEFEGVFHAAMEAVRDHPWPDAPPFFDSLELRVTTAGIERRLDWHDECLSTREALHEDLYFSLLDFFQCRAGRALGERDFRPGQIVPDIQPTEGETRLRVELRPGSADTTIGSVADDIEAAEEPLVPAQIAAELAALGGEPFAFRSAHGRDLWGAAFAGPEPGVAITAGQHANETSGVVGALRAAKRLIGRIRFAVVPQENPDGYALHMRLREAHPRHMLHAARYTALGDDLEYRTAPPLLEKAGRLEAIRRAGARLHLNLHGYPAHEWTRPLTGYLPRGFDLWSVPKGFFLILRHHPGRRAHAEAFLAALAARVIATPGLADFNAAQLAVYRAHAGETPFPVLHGIPCQIVESDRGIAPYTLIPEFPDETIYGAAFRLAHETQLQNVLAAVDLLHAGMLPE
jgi:hypothetical protein